MFSTTNGYSLSDIAAVSGSNHRGGGFGDGDYWWIILLFLFAGNGAWGFGGGSGSGSTIREEISYGFDMNGLENGVRGIQQGLCDGFYAMNTGMLNGFSGIQSSLCQGFAGVNAAITADTVATTGGIHDLSTQLAQCCCDNRYALTSGFADLNYNLATQACDTRRAIADSTRDIIASNEAGVRSILDFLTQDKIATLTAENQSLKFAASQSAQNSFIIANQDAQTAELIRRLSTPCPIPAYVVPNPNCCYGGAGTSCSF
jgi:hypothetical protein